MDQSPACQEADGVPEYVVIHELVHLLEKNHTHRFHALVEEYCPTWREAKKLLATMPLITWKKERRIRMTNKPTSSDIFDIIENGSLDS